jgi:hypothetical protein
LRALPSKERAVIQTIFPLSYPIFPLLPIGSDDINVINYINRPPRQPCQTEPGPEGPPGPPGPAGSFKILPIVITSNHEAGSPYNYIGANLAEESTLTLPLDPIDGTTYVIKLQMGPPIGNRKLKIVPQGGSKIDGLTQLILTVPYQYVTLTYVSGEWYSI